MSGGRTILDRIGSEYGNAELAVVDFGDTEVFTLHGTPGIHLDRAAARRLGEALLRATDPTAAAS